MKIPILLVSDDPRKGTGLARITGEIASRILVDPELSKWYEVGVCGVYGKHFVTKPYPIYPVQGGIDDVFRHLGMFWKDFAGNRPGVVMPICSPNWLWELVYAEMAARERNDWWPVVRMWERRPWKLWPYAAVEGGFKGKFNCYVKETLEGCDRVLMYSKWGIELARNSGMDMKNIDWCHHGIDTGIFRKIPELNPPEDKLRIGCIATNSPRKQHALMLEIVADLKKRLGPGKIDAHIHTNTLVDCWDLPLLANDLDLINEVSFSIDRWTDDTVAKFYNQCHVTVLPTSGEGFGFPVLESACCGTPCITGTYGAQVELPCVSVEPREMLVLGRNNDMFPVYRAEDFADRIMECYGRKDRIDQIDARTWDWSMVWPKFRKWFMDGSCMI